MTKIKTAGQKWFDEMTPVLLKILASLTDEQRKQVFDYVIRLHNFNSENI